MLRKSNTLKGYAVCATDGEIGTVRQFYLDEVAWTVRYLLAGTAASFKEREVLVSPIAIKDIDDDHRQIHIDLKQGKVADSPPYASNRPVTRGYEIAYSAYYGWPAYWGGTSRWGDELYPTELFDVAPFPPPGPGGLGRDESILLGTGQLTGFRVFARDEDLGEVVDFIVSDMSWAVHFLVVDAGRVIPGAQVLISPRWLSQASTYEKMLTLDIPLDAVKSAPPYRPERPVTRDYEMMLFAHYGRADEIDEVFVGRSLVRA